MIGNPMRRWITVVAAVCLSFSALCFGEDPDKVRFAVIGDYGTNDAPEVQVARMVQGWQPDFILTLGDNSYIDREKGKNGFERGVVDHYGAFIQSKEKDPTGEKTRFFPAMGNHDYDSDGIGSGVDAQRLIDYADAFAVPSGEGGIHYYEFARGPVRFFALDSNKNDVWSGSRTDSKQYAWWKKAMGAAKERWKIVYFHHAPYDSGTRHRRDVQMRAWNFERSGVTAVLAGHEHVYERVMINGVPFITNGLGGRHLHGFRPPYVKGSEVRYPVPGETTPEEKRFGAMLVEASDTAITFEAWNLGNKLIDRWPPGAEPIKVAAPPPPPTP
jgi:tartrate-resistant acid phosphatase type 5